MIKPWLCFLALLAACVPQTNTQPAQTSTVPLLIEGGTAQGRIVQATGLQLALPSAPLALARDGDWLYAAFAYQLLVYQNGFVRESLPLPGIPKFVRAKPKPVVGFTDRLYVPGRGSVGYTVLDALNAREGIYWIDEKGVYLERRLLAEGRYTFLAASERYVYAMGREALRLSDSLRIALPGTPKAAVVLNDWYVLTEEGLYRLTLEGLRLGFRAGKFSGLETDGTRLYTLEDGRLLGLGLGLETLSSRSHPQTKGASL